MIFINIQQINNIKKLMKLILDIKRIMKSQKTIDQ